MNKKNPVRALFLVGKLAHALEGYIGVNMYQKKLFKLQGKKGLTYYLGCFHEQ